MVKQIFSPPNFEDAEQTRIARLLHVILLACLAGDLSFALFVLIVIPSQTLFLAPVGAGFLTELGLYYLTRRGRVRLASLMVVVLFLLLFSLVTVLWGGVSASVFGGHLIVILIAAVLLDTTGILLATASSIIAGVAMLVAEASSILPAPRIAEIPALILATQSVFFLVAAVLLHLGSRSLRDALQRARQQEIALAERNRELAERESALRDSTERYHKTLENMLEGCQIIGFDWRYLYLNDAAARHGLRAKEELLGHTMMEIYPGIENTDLFETMRACMEDRLPSHIENLFTYPDGGTAWFELSIQPVDEGIFILSMDISGRKRAEEALRASEMHYRSLFTHMSEGFAYCKMLYEDGQSQDFIYLETNSKFEELTGLHDVVGKKVSAIIPGIRETNPELFEIYGRVALKGEPEQFETYVPGLAMWFSVSVYSPQNEHFVAVFDVITERKRAEEALQKAKDDLVRQNARLEALSQVTLNISAQLDLERLLNALIQSALDLLDAKAGGIYLHRPERDMLEWVVSAGESKEPIGSEVRRGEGLSGRVWESGKPLIVDNYVEWEGRLTNLPENPPAAGLGLPIYAGEEFLGVLNVQDDPAHHTFTEDDAYLLSLFANQAAVAIRNAQLYEQLYAVNRAYKTISECNQVLVRAANEAELLQNICQAIVETGGYRLAWVGFAEQDDEKTVRPVASAGHNRGFLETANITWADEERGRGPTGTAIRTAQTSVTRDVRLDVFHEPWRAAALERGYASVMALPLLENGRAFGALTVAAAETDAFDPQEVDLLAELAGDVAYGIKALRTRAERERARQAEREQRELAEALRDTAAALNSTLDLDEVLDRILNSVGRVVPHDAANIMLLEPDLKTARVVGRLGYEGRTPADIPLPEVNEIADLPNLRQIVESGQPLVIPNTQESEHWVDTPLTAWTRSYAGAPLVRKGRVTGLLNVHSATPGFFSPEHVQRLLAFAGQAAVAIENAGLYETARQRAARQALVGNISRQTTAILEPDELLQQAVRLIGQTFGYAAANIFLVEGNALILRASSHPVMASQKGKLKLRVGEEGTAGWVAAVGQPLLAHDVRHEPRFHPLEGPDDTASTLVVPIKLQNEVIGVLALQSDSPNAISGSDIHTTQTIADQLAIAIQNARLYRELETYSDLLQHAVEERTEELSRVKDRVEAILNSVGEALVVVKPDGRIQQVNPAFETQTGYRMRDAALSHLRDFLPEEGPVFADIFEEVRRTMLDNREWRGEMPIRRKDGSSYDAAVTIAPLRNQQGEVIAAVGALRDISPLKELDRMKDAFVSNVSHELRTPITGLKLFLGLMERELPPEPRDKFLPTLRRETERLGLIIEDVLNLSRLDQGRVEMNLKRVELDALAAEYVSDRVPLAERKGVSLMLEEGGDMPSVQADKGLLGQVLSILLTNAMNYTPSGGTVTVSTHVQQQADGAWAGFSVSDDGPGIPLEEQAQLFERFYRGKVGHESGAPGTGLGLAIAREIVERHAGRIELESEGVPGKGATFRVWLRAEEK